MNPNPMNGNGMGGGMGMGYGGDMAMGYGGMGYGGGYGGLGSPMQYPQYGYGQAYGNLGAMEMNKGMANENIGRMQGAIGFEEIRHGHILKGAVDVGKGVFNYKRGEHQMENGLGNMGYQGGYGYY
jgi:hypothetical protein